MAPGLPPGAPEGVHPSPEAPGGDRYTPGVATVEPAEAAAILPAPPDGSRAGIEPTARHAHGRTQRRRSSWSRFRWAGSAALAVWAVGLVALSTFVYHRAFLGEDFATYNQAWTLIGQGHLNPYDTVYGFPFVQADFELIIWPLALLHLVIPQPIVLLWVQDLAMAGTGIVTFVWITEYLERRQMRRVVGVAIAVAALVVIMVDPGVYKSLQFDIHMEPLATFFLLLAGRDLWHGRIRRAWIWIPIVLLCGSFSAIMVVGLGVSALLAGRETRRSGLLMVAAGLAWTVLISALHANQGSGLTLYAYLAGRPTLSGGGGVALVLVGILTHPWRVTDQLDRRLGDAYTLIKPVGVVGLANAWGFGVPVTVMTVDALNSRPDFLTDSYQNFAVFPFVLLGTVMVLVWLAQWLSRWLSRGWIVSVVVGALALAQALAYGFTASPTSVRWTTSQVSSAVAAQLRTALARTPTDAETIVTLDVMGRFCSRQWCFFFYPDGPRPVHSRDVVFVFDTSNESLTTPAGSAYAIAYVRDTLHARVLVDADGVAAFDWTPPAGTTSVTVPTSPTAG